MSSSLWVHSFIKIRFFNRVLRFLRSKTSPKPCSTPSDPPDISRAVRETEERIVRNHDPAPELQRTVKSLLFGRLEEKLTAAGDIQKLIKENVKVRKLMVELGVIPALVSMADSDQLVAVTALTELANGSLQNRALMVEEGILTKLPNNIQFVAMDSSSHEFAELLLSLSSLANTQLFLASTETVIVFLLSILNSESKPKAKNSCLATLFNISTVLENADTLIANGVIPILLRFSSTKEFAEKSLATLGNLVMTSRGKKALESDSTFAETLIEILRWEEKPKCQEMSSYIIMIVADQSWAQRKRLAECGIVTELLELALLGTPLAQKRALKLLQWFKEERRARIGAHSGPQTERVAEGAMGNQTQIEEGKKTMRKLVEQSLNRNMETIIRRANGGECSEIRTLVSCPSSKSLS